MSSRKKQATTAQPTETPKAPRGFARLSAEERKAAAQYAAFCRSAQSDPREMTRKAREAQAQARAREVDPHGLLSPAERARRAEALRQAQLARMRLARWGKVSA